MNKRVREGWGRGGGDVVEYLDNEKCLRASPHIWAGK